MITLPADFLYRVTLRVRGSKGQRQVAILAVIQPLLQTALIKYGIDNDYRACYWAGQVCEECDNFCTTEEYASGAAYEGRHDLGNIHPGDGVRYKGRGLIELTGLSNYAIYGPLLGLDLVNHPELAADPVNSLAIACLFWQKHGLSALADQEDIETITHKINGGLNGLAQRQLYTDRAFQVLGYATEG